VSGVGSAAAGAAAAAAGAAGASLANLIDVELQILAAEGQALRALLAEGDVVQAQVLPPNGLTDLLSIAGYRVAATLPPNLTPGDVITVAVTSTANGQVAVQIVPAETPLTNAVPPVDPETADPGTPGGAAGPGVPGSTSTGTAAAPTASGTTGASPPPAGSGSASGAAAAAGTAPPVAPPAAFFAAAAVRTAGSPNAAVPSVIVSASALARSISSAAGATPPPVASAGDSGYEAGETIAARAPRAPAAAPAAPLSGSIEARIAAARATVVSGGATLPPPGASAARLNPLPPPPSTAPLPANPRPFVAPPIFTRSTPIASAEPESAPVAAEPAPSLAQTPPPVAVAPAASLAAAPARGLAVYAEPVALLRALRLPVTPTNVAAAKLALDQPQRLASAISTLERALPASTSDSRVATLRTIAAFIGRLDPRSPTLATQIASYVDHALDGSEPKLGTLLAATQDAADAQGAVEPEAIAANAGADVVAENATVPTAQLAQSAASSAALQYDFKSQLLSLAQAPPPNITAALADAVSGTLTALTAMQMQTQNMQTAQSINVNLPIALPNGTANAQIRIDRDAPEPGGTPLDGDNFHIAFILETASLGVVAIDLVTVGRTVTLDIKTEATLAAMRFAKQLERLTERLRALRYTVAKAQSSVAAPGTASVFSTVTSTAPAGPVDPSALVDRSA
jgi:hypothetical protein